MWVNGFLVALFITTGVCKTVLHLPAKDAYDRWGILGYIRSVERVHCGSSGLEYGTASRVRNANRIGCQASSHAVSNGGNK